MICMYISYLFLLYNLYLYYTGSESPNSSQRMLGTCLFMSDNKSVEITSGDMDTTYTDITTTQLFSTESVLTGTSTILAMVSTSPLSMSLFTHDADTIGSSSFTKHMFKCSDINTLSTMGDGLSTTSNKGASNFIVCTPVTRSSSVTPSKTMALESTDSEMATLHASDTKLDKELLSSMHTLTTSSSLYSTRIIYDEHTDNMDTTELFTTINGFYSETSTTGLQSNSLPAIMSVPTIITRRDSTYTSMSKVNTKSTPMGSSSPVSTDSMHIISTAKVVKETSYMLSWNGGFASEIKSPHSSFSEFTTTRNSTVLASSSILNVITATELTSVQTSLLDYTSAYNSTVLMTSSILDITVGTNQITITGTQHVKCIHINVQ